MFNGMLTSKKVEAIPIGLGSTRIYFPEDGADTYIFYPSTASAITGFIYLPVSTYVGRIINIRLLPASNVQPSGIAANLDIHYGKLKISEIGAGGSASFLFVGDDVAASLNTAGGNTSKWISISSGDSASDGTTLNSCSLGGGSSTASTSLAIGYNAIASGSASVAIGSGASASGANAIAIGDQSTANQTGGISMGYASSVAAIASISLGRYAGTVASISMCVRPASSNGLVGNGDNQVVTYMPHRQTTDATPVYLTSSNAVASTINLIGQLNNSATTIVGTVLARESATGDSAMWEVKFLMKRGANASATVLVGTPTVTKLFNDAGAAAWTISVNADTTNGGAYILATGEAAKTIKWTSDLTGSFVTG